jgi:alpha-1,6-mannosyltransferase
VKGRRFFGLLGSGGVLLALTGLGLYLQRHGDTDGFVAVAFGQGAVYLIAIGLVWRSAPSRRAMTVILGVAVAARIAVVLAPPYLSNDVYRYVWDGRVIAAGINPYRYVPADPRLAALRDPEIFPNINRSNYARTIYPPVAEMTFFAVTRVSASPVAMKTAMVVFEAIAAALLLRLLRSSGQPASRIVVYLWHPLPLWEFAGSGHIDAAIVAMVALALWSRRHAAGWLAGLALAGGTLAKFYPAAIFPALWRRRDWRMPAVFAAVVILAYLPFVGAGWRVFGFLPQYAVEEGFTGAGAGFYLWEVAKLMPRLGGMSAVPYIGAAACLMAGLALWVAFRRRSRDDDVRGTALPRGRDDDVRGAALLAGAFMLLLSPHYPWYFAWLIVFACLVPSPAFVWLTLASFLLYLVPVWPQLMHSWHWLLAQSALYVPFLALAAAEPWRRRRSEQAKHGEHASR